MEGGQNSFGIASPIQIAIDEDYVKQRIDELIQERLDRRLDKEWLGMNDMEYLLSLEARWITKHIANHPIVQMNGWAKKTGDATNSKWIFLNKEIRAFVRNYLKKEM